MIAANWHRSICNEMRLKSPRRMINRHILTDIHRKKRSASSATVGYGDISAVEMTEGSCNASLIRISWNQSTAYSRSIGPSVTFGGRYIYIWVVRKFDLVTVHVKLMYVRNRCEIMDQIVVQNGSQDTSLNVIKLCSANGKFFHRTASGAILQAEG